MRRGRGARRIVRLMDAAVSTRNAMLAPLLLGAAVAAGLLTGSGEAFRGFLALGGAAWLLSVVNLSRSRRPGDPEDVIAERRRILKEVDAGLAEGARRLMGRGNAAGQYGPPFDPSAESGYDSAE
ncbi:MAG: hypothetical protein ACR2PL_04420 [Dehalococcoidia bacterium]